VDVTSLKLRRT